MNHYNIPSDSMSLQKQFNNDLSVDSSVDMHMMSVRNTSVHMKDENQQQQARDIDICTRSPVRSSLHKHRNASSCSEDATMHSSSVKEHFENDEGNPSSSPRNNSEQASEDVNSSPRKHRNVASPRKENDEKANEDVRSSPRKRSNVASPRKDNTEQASEDINSSPRKHRNVASPRKENDEKANEDVRSSPRKHRNVASPKKDNIERACKVKRTSPRMHQNASSHVYVGLSMNSSQPSVHRYASSPIQHPPVGSSPRRHRKFLSPVKETPTDIANDSLVHQNSPALSLRRSSRKRHEMSPYNQSLNKIHYNIIESGHTLELRSRSVSPLREVTPQPTDSPDGSSVSSVDGTDDPVPSSLMMADVTKAVIHGRLDSSLSVLKQVHNAQNHSSVLLNDSKDGATLLTTQKCNIGLLDELSSTDDYSPKRHARSDEDLEGLSLVAPKRQRKNSSSTLRVSTSNVNCSLEESPDSVSSDRSTTATLNNLGKLLSKKEKKAMRREHMKEKRLLEKTQSRRRKLLERRIKNPRQSSQSREKYEEKLEILREEQFREIQDLRLKRKNMFTNNPPLESVTARKASKKSRKVAVADDPVASEFIQRLKKVSSAIRERKALVDATERITMCTHNIDDGGGDGDDDSEYDFGGQKDSEPSGSAEEYMRIVAARNHTLSLATDFREVSMRRLMVAEWLPELQRSRVTFVTGRFMERVGFEGVDKDGAPLLTREETVYLLEKDNLRLFYGGIPMSVQQAFATLLPSDFSRECFAIYLHLRKTGYVVRRYFDDDDDGSLCDESSSADSFDINDDPDMKMEDNDDNNIDSVNFSRTSMFPIKFKQAKFSTLVADAFRKVTDNVTRLFRPPFSNINDSVVDARCVYPQVASASSNGCCVNENDSSDDDDEEELLPLVSPLLVLSQGYHELYAALPLTKAFTSQPNHHEMITEAVAREGIKRKPRINFAAFANVPGIPFRKSEANVPDFAISVYSYFEPAPSLAVRLSLLNSCGSVPLKLAVVDQGSVSFFSIWDEPTPTIIGATVK